MKWILLLSRLVLGACAGLAIGLGSVAVLAGALTSVQAIRSTLGLNLGEHLASILNLPLVVFALPFTDGILSPGILTGLIAHRLRSARSLIITGCLTGFLFNLSIWITHSVFDFVLFSGFIVLEIWIAFAVSRIDAWGLTAFTRCPHENPWFLQTRRFWVLGMLFFSISIFIGTQTCHTGIRRAPQFEEQIVNFVHQRQPGSQMALLNGMNMEGWIAHGLGKWDYGEEEVTIRRGSGYLATRCVEFSDLILEVDVRVNPRGNSGIFFRARDPGFGLRSQPVGYEAQIDFHDPKNPTGSLYNRATAHPVIGQDGEWFHMQISAIGPRIQIQVNGALVVDATDSAYTQGMIALQAHDPYSVVSFKNLSIRIPDRIPATN